MWLLVQFVTKFWLFIFALFLANKKIVHRFICKICGKSLLINYFPEPLIIYQHYLFFRTDFRLACDHCKLHVIYDFFGFWNLFKQQQLLNKSNSSSNCMLLFACLPSKCREKLMKVNIDIKNTLILKFQSSLLWNWFFIIQLFSLALTSIQISCYENKATCRHRCFMSSSIFNVA